MHAQHQDRAPLTPLENHPPCERTAEFSETIFTCGLPRHGYSHPFKKKSMLLILYHYKTK
jgi:hypothetical protein